MHHQPRVILLLLQLALLLEHRESSSLRGRQALLQHPDLALHRLLRVAAAGPGEGRELLAGGGGYKKRDSTIFLSAIPPRRKARETNSSLPGLERRDLVLERLTLDGQMLLLALEVLKLVLKTPLALHEAVILRLAEDDPLFVEGRLQVLVALLRAVECH